MLDVNSTAELGEAAAPARPLAGDKESTRNASGGVKLSGSKLLLVDFRNGEAVRDHPEIEPLLLEGWRIKSAVPRLVESRGTRLLVVLAPPMAQRVDRNLA